MVCSSLPCLQSVPPLMPWTRWDEGPARPGGLGGVGGRGPGSPGRPLGSRDLHLVALGWRMAYGSGRTKSSSESSAGTRPLRPTGQQLQLWLLRSL